jgi:hypothetical protein
MRRANGFEGGFQPSGNVRLVREAMPLEYQNLLKNNPLLAGIEGELKTVGAWSDLEIRTAQLVLSVVTIVELQKQIAGYQQLLTGPTDTDEQKRRKRKKFLQGA